MPDAPNDNKKPFPVPEEKRKGYKLSPLMKRFCEEYVADPQLNASAAVLRAGYNTKYPSVIANKLLRNALVSSHIAELTMARNKRVKIDADYVIHELVALVEKTKEGENFNPQAAARCLELLGKHLRMFIEKTEISGPDGEAIKLEKVRSDADAFTSAIASLAKRAGARGVAELPATGTEG